MTNLDLLTQIDSNVKYLRESFDEHKKAFNDHIAHDEKVNHDFLLPLWEAHQRNKGAASIAIILWSSLTSIATLAVAYLTGIVHK